MVRMIEKANRQLLVGFFMFGSVSPLRWRDFLAVLYCFARLPPVCEEYFATAVATFFRPASKEGKGAPTQRGSGSVEEEILYFTLSLTTKGVKERAI